MDIGNATLFKMMGRKMNWLAERQTVLSQNLANANTPGYKARDVKAASFKDLVGASSGASMTTTHPNHVAGLKGGSGNFKTFEAKTYETSPDGNSVNVEEQMLNVSSTASQHKQVTNLYKRHMGMVRRAVGGGSN